MKKLGEFIHRILSVFLLGLLCVSCVGCSHTNYEINDNSVYFKLGDAIWKYEKGEAERFIENDIYENFKFDGHTLCWVGNSEGGVSCINLLDVDTRKNIQLETNFEIYDLTYVNDYIVFSGVSNKDFSYDIIAKKISTGEELCVSDTQNNQVEFS